MTRVSAGEVRSEGSLAPSVPGQPVTLKTIRRFVERGEKFACLTCYDATTARWLERAGVPLLLVGDTAAEMILGLPGTIHAPLDFLIALTAAVKRGAPSTFVMGDMPFMSYQADDGEALRNAGRFLTEGNADAVKVEVDRSYAPLVDKMARAGIPVVAHIGARPQLSKRGGGYASAGRSAAEARMLLADAAALQSAGATMLLIEATPAEVAQRIVERTTLPVIGCGAGPACHGQIVVLQDLLGLSEWQPGFAHPVSYLGEHLVAAARRWTAMVRAGDLGEHPYRMSDGEETKLEDDPEESPAMRKLGAYGPSLIVLVTVVIVLKAGPSAVWQLTYAHDHARIVQAAEGLEHNPILQQINQAYRDVAALVSPSVVHISTERIVRDRLGQVRPGGFAGSGWIYDEDGHIVTNYHVVEKAERIEVQLNSGQTRPATVAGFDQFTDIAVLKVAAGQLFPAARAAQEPGGQFEAVRQGDLVFAFGSPFDFRFSMSSGIVSGTGRSVGVIRDENDRWLGYENFIQVDAAINRGNSGGPLTDTRGRVIGMNTAIATEKGSRLDEGQFAGVGLAIPIDMIEPVVTQLIETGAVQKGFLGVAVLDYTDTVASELGRMGFRGDGLVVARVEPETTAWSSGLKLGDVIRMVAEQPVATPAQARSVVEGLADDDLIALSLWRYDARSDEGQDVVITVPALVARSFHGVELMTLDRELDDWVKLLGSEGHGVRIAHVEPHTPAHDAGLRCRDSVTLLDGEPVLSAAQLRSKISSMLPGDVAQLRVWRYEEARARGEVLTLDVQLDRLDLLRASGAPAPEDGPVALREVGIARMATCTPQLAARAGVPYHPGILVQEIVEGSALQGGMEPGSVIVAVMDRPVATLEEFLTLLGDFDLRRGRGARVRFLHPDGRSDDVLLRLQ